MAGEENSKFRTTARISKSAAIQCFLETSSHPSLTFAGDGIATLVLTTTARLARLNLSLIWVKAGGPKQIRFLGKPQHPLRS